MLTYSSAKVSQSEFVTEAKLGTSHSLLCSTKLVDFSLLLIIEYDTGSYKFFALVDSSASINFVSK